MFKFHKWMVNAIQVYNAGIRLQLSIAVCKDSNVILALVFAETEMIGILRIMITSWRDVTKHQNMAL